MIQFYISEIFVILQLKKQQVGVLEQDIELYPFCCFSVTIHIAEQEEANFLCKFLKFQTFYVCCFSFVLIHKK